MNSLWIDNLKYDHHSSAITAELTCAAATGYLNQHFTGFPVVPGVVMLEGFRQAFQQSASCLKDYGNISSFEQFRFQEFVRPGQTVQLFMLIDEKNGTIQCRGLVNDKTVTRGRILFRPDVVCPEKSYMNGNCDSFAHWRWYRDWQQAEAGSVETRLSPPMHPELNREGLIPEPFIFEGIAQTGVQLLQEHFPSQDVVALAKIPSLIIKNTTDYRKPVQLHVTAEQLDGHGGRFSGTAYADDLLLMKTEFLLAYSDQAKSVSASENFQHGLKSVAS